LENKKKRRNFSLPLARPISAHARDLAPAGPGRGGGGPRPRARDLPPPAHSARATAPTDTPSPLVSRLPLALARARTADTPSPPVSRPIPSPRTASPRSPPTTVLSLAPSPRRTKKFGTTSSSPLWPHPCTAPPHRVVSSSPLCGINFGVVQPHRRLHSSAAPLPSGAYKRIASSTSLPRTSLRHPSPPRPSSIALASPSSSSPVSPSPSFPSPLIVQRAIN
jgi:hypothetical protein